MTKKDYVAIAAVMNCIYDATVDTDYARGTRNTRDTLSRQLADLMARDNPKFDRARFLTACGVN
jgi:hypothetical protein